jgi:hypothetical protein
MNYQFLIMMFPKQMLPMPISLRARTVLKGVEAQTPELPDSLVVCDCIEKHANLLG